jgi:hypothetical protein
MKLSNIKEWERAKDALYSVYDREYLADTWPARLGFAELIALQSDGGLNAWKTCILSALYNGDIPVQDEQWFLGTIEPSEFWTGQKPKTVLIPPCQKHQGDNIAFFSSELVTKCTVSPKDFAEYLKQQGEKPSKYILAWFSACGVDIETEPDSPLEPDKTEPEQRKPAKVSSERKRKDNLTRAIEAAIKSFGCKPSLEDLWQFFINDRDETGIVQDSTDEKITWMDTKGRFQDTTKKALANRLTAY